MLPKRCISRILSGAESTLANVLILKDLWKWRAHEKVDKVNGGKGGSYSERDAAGTSLLNARRGGRLEELRISWRKITGILSNSADLSKK